MPRPEVRLPAEPRSTWKLFPSEATKRPGLVIVTDGQGQLLARIDPITRRRTSAAGRYQRTLAATGWNGPAGYGRHGPAPVVEPARPRSRPDYSLTLEADRDRRR